MCERFLKIRDQLRTNLKVFHKFVIISIGRVVPSKNIEIVLQAMSALPGPLKDIVILIICGGPTNDNYKAQLLQLANDLKLQHNVIFYGQVTEEEKAMLLCSADLFVFPTRSEGFGIVILEALAAGLPVLASNINTIESFMNQINQNTATYLLDPKNHCEWATHIRLAYDDRETSNKARRLRKPTSNFKWSALAKETLNIYETVKKPIV